MFCAMRSCITRTGHSKEHLMTEYPPLLQFFLSRLLFGQHACTKSYVRNREIDKTTNAACQFHVQNTRSNRQVQYQANKRKFEQKVQTPISIGLPLAIHSRVRNKYLVNNLSELYIGCDYQKILDIEKCLEQVSLSTRTQLMDFVFREERC